MSLQTVNWGDKAQIRFLPRVLAPKDVEKAVELVPPSFENLPKDSFVALNEGNGYVVAALPKPIAQTFPVPTQGISVQEAIQQALEKTTTFLKSQT